MESLKNIFETARTLFFINCGILFFLGFLVKNELAGNLAQMGLFIFDIPCVFFGLVTLLAGMKLKEDRFHSTAESIIVFLLLLGFAFFLFFQFAYPDLI